ncbi:ATP-dependent RNA helicase DDX18-like 2 [Homarus americanus]|uniref:ATP-dependent RNA helicase DDX18-like 1 n=1 Tax=Homarus americanus TaxID=6706 RepID=A0A8J5JH85_HOMAM|nr:ATP-dependent RNA helicase DDX18-like 1 [Homarus americanus]KAG7177910.1 ATP-dependent RNA helicase DDX18-like 2 [Homarus americanus]
MLFSATKDNKTNELVKLALKSEPMEVDVDADKINATVEDWNKVRYRVHSSVVKNCPCWWQWQCTLVSFVREIGFVHYLKAQKINVDSMDITWSKVANIQSQVAKCFLVPPLVDLGFQLAEDLSRGGGGATVEQETSGKDQNIQTN